MAYRERTIQQLDPLGALGARTLSLGAALAAPAFAVIMTWFNREDISSQLLALLALAVVTVAAGVIIIGSEPTRAPMRRRTFIIAIGGATIAAALSAASMWDSNRFVQDDWGPVSIGTLLIASAPYRQARELALGGLLSAIFIGFLVLLQSPSFVTPVPAMVFVLVATAPILTMAFGSAAITGAIIRSIRRWRIRATVAAQAAVSRLHDGIARSVQQDRVTILNRDVVPYFTGVLQRGELTEDDHTTARVISESIRSVMVAEVDRSWLDGVIEQAGAATLGRKAPGSEAVQDDERLAAAMTTDQRTAIRAFIVALFSHPRFDPDGFDIGITHASYHCLATIRATFADGESSFRIDLAPYFAVLRVVFVDVDVDYTDDTLTLRFFYDER
jgi:hypothetical protein